MQESGVFEKACREISNLKARYFRALDTKDFDTLFGLIADDACIDFRGVASSGDQSAIPSIDGDAGLMDGKTFKAFLFDLVPQLTTIHQGSMPEFSDAGDGKMACIWAMEDLVWYPEGQGPRFLHGWGHYHERYRRENGAWIIEWLKLTRIKVELSDARSSGS